MLAPRKYSFEFFIIFDFDLKSDETLVEEPGTEKRRQVSGARVSTEVGLRFKISFIFHPFV